MNKIHYWQRKCWDSLNGRRHRLPHALLITGKTGLGKSHLAQTFAQSLLCMDVGKAGDDPCGTCQACGWFDLGNHPDYRLVQPDILAPELEDEPKKDKKKSDQIRIEQIRDLERFLAIGTHRGGLRIVVTDPADTMNMVTQNALLKSLEEPPPSTLFMLVTSRPQRLLPTIRSRCQLVQFLPPAAPIAQAWLEEQGFANAAAALTAAGGAPLAAIKAAEWSEPHGAFLSKIQQQRFDPILLAEVCNGLEPSLVVNWLQRWVCDLLQSQATGMLQYHPDLSSPIRSIAQRANPQALSNLMRRLAQARSLATHPLNPKLFFEDIFLEYSAGISNE